MRSVLNAVCSLGVANVHLTNVHFTELMRRSEMTKKWKKFSMNVTKRNISFQPLQRMKSGFHYVPYVSLSELSPILWLSPYGLEKKNDLVSRVSRKDLS